MTMIARGRSVNKKRGHLPFFPPVDGSVDIGIANQMTIGQAVDLE